MAIAILLAAGKGQRFSRDLPKQFYLYKGQPLLSYSLDTLLSVSEIEKIVVVVDPNSVNHLSGIQSVSQNSDNVLIVHGGVSRSESISAGLKVALSLDNQNQSVILIHDSSRPFVSKKHFQKLLSEFGLKDAVLTTTAIQDAYAVKDDRGNFQFLTDRSLVTFQTPIALSYEVAKTLLSNLSPELKFGIAGLLIQLGLNLSFVETDGSTRKITFKHDLP